MSVRKIHGIVIDADTIDGLNAQNAANQVPVLDAGADIPDAQIPDTITRDTELTTHAGLDTGVHGAGASTLATAANIATHAGLATVHQDAPALIATHTGLPTAHQDAPALIATHAALATHLVSGLINMWHGTIATIPSGWVICDGNNSTPNLLTRFIEGVATAATNPGATGGATAKATAGHVHTGPSHAHNVTIPSIADHYESGAYTLGRDGTYTSTAGGTGNTGSKTDSISDIRPLFYDVAFLMKT